MTDNPYQSPIETKPLNAEEFTVQCGGVGVRFLAYLVDVLPIVLVSAVIFYVFLGFDQAFQQYLMARGDNNARREFLRQRNQIRDLSFLIYILYCTLAECSPMQGTFGKHLLGLRVSDEQGNRLTMARSLRRNFAKIISYIPLGLGFLWAIWSKRNRAWHDMIGKTLVVKSQ